MQNIFRFFFLLIFISSTNIECYSQQPQEYLYKNPLRFFNTDILNYLQILHKNQQYDKMRPFFYGPAIDNLNKNDLIVKLSNASFGYSLKRVGIITKSKTSWSLTYRRIILGTNENFNIDCILINNTCKIYIDDNTWETLFNRKY
jgi:hypothetical protein